MLKRRVIKNGRRGAGGGGRVVRLLLSSMKRRGTVSIAGWHIYDVLDNDSLILIYNNIRAIAPIFGILWI